MKPESIVVRMNLNTLLRLKKMFPALGDETVKNYFQRLAKYLEDLK